MYHAKLSCCVAILGITIRNMGHDTSCFTVTSVVCKNDVARLRVRASMSCTGSIPRCALSVRATAAPVEMDCLVYRNILNLIPGFDSDEEFGPFCHHTPFLGDGLGLMTFAFCKLSLIFPMFARLHDNASFGPVGWYSKGRKGKAGMYVIARIYTSLQTWMLFDRNKLNQSPQNMDYFFFF